MQQNHLVKTDFGPLPRVSDSVDLGRDPKIGIHNTFLGDADAAGWLGDHTLKTSSLNAVLMCYDREHILAKPEADLTASLAL